jgi:hypothetical protein
VHDLDPVRFASIQKPDAIQIDEAISSKSKATFG